MYVKSASSLLAVSLAVAAAQNITTSEFAVTASTCPAQVGMDYIGNDLLSLPGAAGDCCYKCQTTTGCKVYSWSDWNGGTCFLKYARGQAKFSAGVTSGALPEVVAAQWNVETNVNYVANDLANAPAKTATECQPLCALFTGCKAFTWSDWNGGTCWLKTLRSAVSSQTGATSASMVYADPAPVSEHVAVKIRSGAIPSRSVNLGGWLVGEWWMSKTSPAWSGVPTDITNLGEHYTMSYQISQGKRDVGTAQFEAHRASWITEGDIQEIASQGLNMVRVPVGFWIVDDIPGIEPTPISSVFARGALKYLDKLINEWAVKYNIGVYLSLHAHQGSQNGADHSAAQNFGHTYWSDYQNNVDNSVRFATNLAARYRNSKVFVGLQLMNEPSGATNEDVVKQYYLRTYSLIRGTGNDCIIGVSPMLSKQDKNTFGDFMNWPAYYNVWVEWHVYYKWGYENLSEDTIISLVKQYRESHFVGWQGNWLLIGEWSLGNGWNEEKFKDVNKLKEFAAAQIQQYSEAHAGWSFWAWHHDDEYLKESDGRNVISGWNLRQLLRMGIFTIPK